MLGAGLAQSSASVLARSIFSRRAVSMASTYIRSMHPKTAIRPERSAIERILRSGWVAQLKIHGHRAQIHIPADKAKKMLVYTRQGTVHKQKLSPEMVSELHRLFLPRKDWNVIDAEWLKPEDKLFVFDFIKKEGELLSQFTFPERWRMLPREFISPRITVLPLIKNVEQCLEILSQEKPHAEGLVFKSRSRAGFSDTSIIRCRR